MNGIDTTLPLKIAGYTFGTRESAVSPLSDADLRLLEATIGWSDADCAVLQRHADLFRGQAEPMVDSWRAAIAAQAHLAQWFTGPDGKPDNEYKARVKKAFRAVGYRRSAPST